MFEGLEIVLPPLAETKDMDALWQWLFDSLHQNIGQNTADSGLGIALSRYLFHQVIQGLGAFDSFFEPAGQFLIDLENPCQGRICQDLVAEQGPIILPRNLRRG